MPPQTQMPLPDGRTVTMWRGAPGRQPDNLRAWDAADELALLHLSEEGLLPDAGDSTPRTWLVVDDRFGALQVGLAAMGIRAATWADSVLAQRQAAANLSTNGLATLAGTIVDGDLEPPTADVVLLRIPKSTALLHDQLRRLMGAVPAGALIMGIGMTRSIHSSTVAAFEQLVGPTTTTRARKKARLVLGTADPDGREAQQTSTDAAFDVRGVQVTARAGVFSQERLDEGTALLIDALLPLVEARATARLDLVDLGCGSGVVGTVVAVYHSRANIVFTDVSHRAVASARATFSGAHGERPAAFHVADGLSACEDGSADVVAVNPPFHRGHEVGDQVAWDMFSDARRVLRPGGLLVAVGNQHLAHHAKLKRLYGNVTVLASNPGYVVLQSVRR